MYVPIVDTLELRLNKRFIVNSLYLDICSCNYFINKKLCQISNLLVFSIKLFVTETSILNIHPFTIQKAILILMVILHSGLPFPTKDPAVFS